MTAVDRLVYIMDCRRKLTYKDHCTICGDENPYCVALPDTRTVECEKCAARRIWQEITKPKLDVDDFARL